MKGYFHVMIQESAASMSPHGHPVEHRWEIQQTRVTHGHHVAAGTHPFCVRYPAIMGRDQVPHPEPLVADSVTMIFANFDRLLKK